MGSNGNKSFAFWRNRNPAELDYLEVTSIKAHSVDFSTAWPRRVHPVDEFLLVVKVYVDDVVQALSGETI